MTNSPRKVSDIDAKCRENAFEVIFGANVFSLVAIFIRSFCTLCRMTKNLIDIQTPAFVFNGSGPPNHSPLPAPQIPDPPQL